MKLRDLTSPTFQNSYRKLTAQPLPGATAWHLAKLTRKIEEALKDYNEVRSSLLNRLADKDENGKAIMIQEIDGSIAYKLSDSAKEQFSTELQPILEQEIAVSTIRASELGADCILAVEDFLYLGDLICD